MNISCYNDSMSFLDDMGLWGHQKEAVMRYYERLREGKKYFALFLEQGTGKTATSIAILRLIWRMHKEPKRTLILCPLIVVKNWSREIAKFTPEAVSREVVVLEGDKKKRIRTLEENLDKNIFITNLDVLNTHFWQKHLSKMRFDVLIFDESQKIKSHNSKRSKELRKVSDTIPYKIILSGTPILNSMMDIWGQFRVLDRNILPENFFVFRSKFFTDKNSGMPKYKHFPDWQPKGESYGVLERIISENSIRKTKEEVLDLPPLVRQQVYVPLTSEQKKVYKQMSQEFIAFLDDEACVAEIALTKLLRLMQICCGLFRVDDSGYKRVATKKISALHELLEDIAPHHKVIVWANFAENYKDIAGVCDSLGLAYRMITGGQNAQERQQGIDDFQTDDSVRVMIANQSAGGVGVNLTAASYMIYFGRNFSLNDDLQSEARAHRGGSEVHESITRIDIITEDTVEEEVTAALRGKKKLAELLLDIRRRYDSTNGRQGVFIPVVEGEMR